MDSGRKWQCKLNIAPCFFHGTLQTFKKIRAEMNSSRCSTVLIETRNELAQLAPEWNALLRTSNADSIFLTWEWISSWLETILPDAALMVVAVRDSEQQLIALAPFYRSRLYLFGRISYQCLRILGDSNSGAEYPDIIIKRGMEEAAIPMMAQLYSEHAKKWDWVWLLNIAGWAGALERCTRVFQPSTFTIKKQPYSFSSMPLPNSWEEFILLLPKGRASILRRQNQRASRQHTLEIHHCTQAEDLPSFLTTFFSLHAQRWQDKGQLGSFARRPGMEEFYRDFARKALETGWLAFFSLSLDGIPQAIQYGYIYNNIFHQLQEGYDPEGLPGLGNVLREKVICWCMEQHIREYDFLGVHSPHKVSWGSTERWGWRLFLGRRSLKNLFIRFAGIWPSGRFIKP
ncbi:MAG: GNAT family N-acetyltransferase [Gammaproteobacteria bacterium]|nr:GNAT family N-acetyltransferase [Gammaproteobacteria bacterium]